MFSHSDRLPQQTPPHQAAPADSPTLRPWALSRVSGYLEIAELPDYTVTIDPVTQLGQYLGSDGRVIEMKHRKTNRATEQKTRVSKGDGNSPSRYDDDSTQDSEQD